MCLLHDITVELIHYNDFLWKYIKCFIFIFFRLHHLPIWSMGRLDVLGAIKRCKTGVGIKVENLWKTTTRMCFIDLTFYAFNFAIHANLGIVECRIKYFEIITSCISGTHCFIQQSLSTYISSMFTKCVLLG